MLGKRSNLWILLGQGKFELALPRGSRFSAGPPFFPCRLAPRRRRCGGENQQQRLFSTQQTPTPPYQSAFLLQAASSEVTAGSCRGSRRTVLAQASYEVMNFLFLFI